MTKTNNTPLLITEDYWANSQLSIVRRTGQCRFNGQQYIIVTSKAATSTSAAR